MRKKIKVLKVSSKREAIIHPEYAPFYHYKKKKGGVMNSKKKKKREIVHKGLLLDNLPSYLEYKNKL